jgi:hypothetical protein
MTLPSRKTLWANVLCLGALGWIYGGDLADALRVRTAEVSAFYVPPSPTRAAVVLGLAGVGLAVFLGGLARGRPEGFKGYRLLPILLVGALFMDLALSEGRPPVDSDELATMALHRFQEEAQKQASETAVPTRADVLQPLVDALGAPPYLERGVPARAYALQVRSQCEGPLRDAPGTRPGTLLYCVARDGKQAWVTLVGLPAGVRFGAPAVLSQEDGPRLAVVRTRSPTRDDAPPPDAELLDLPIEEGGMKVSPGP